MVESGIYFLLQSDGAIVLSPKLLFWFEVEQLGGALVADHEALSGDDLPEKPLVELGELQEKHQCDTVKPRDILVNLSNPHMYPDDE